MFADWAGRHGVARGAIVAMRQGRAVHAIGLGDQVPSQRAPAGETTGDLLPALLREAA